MAGDALRKVPGGEGREVGGYQVVEAHPPPQQLDRLHEQQPVQQREPEGRAGDPQQTPVPGDARPVEDRHGGQRRQSGRQPHHPGPGCQRIGPHPQVPADERSPVGEGHHGQEGIETSRGPVLHTAGCGESLRRQEQQGPDQQEQTRQLAPALDERAPRTGGVGRPAGDGQVPYPEGRRQQGPGGQEDDERASPVYG